jgi:hypothetical protein
MIFAKIKFNRGFHKQGPKPILFDMAFGGGGARLTPIFFYSVAAAAGVAAPIGLNENKPKILSVHGTICTTICTFQLFSKLYNKFYKIFDVINAWERQTILPSRSECTRSNRVLCGAGQL